MYINETHIIERILMKLNRISDYQE